MKKMAWKGTMAVILLCVSFSGFAGAPAQTPDQLIKNLVEAARKGDVEGFLSGLTEGSRKAVTESVANRSALRQALEDFEKALDERFGRGAEVLATPQDDLKTAIGRLAGAEVISQAERPDGSVELRVKTAIKVEDEHTVNREDTLVARREGGDWKLALGFAADRGMTAERKAAAGRIAREVRDGKYKDRLAAMLALADAWARKEGPTK
jgi:hypothetical protein